MLEPAGNEDDYRLADQTLTSPACQVLLPLECLSPDMFDAARILRCGGALPLRREWCIDATEAS